ncbi:transketolase [Gammaproteobacteria bacterium]|nr:transketolase [SAR86 cluster bacterium]MDB3880961.1 transketolase [Gammaproteobacteria bacterium]
MTKSSSSKSANALRMLAVDSVKQANSGHSGMPMGMADIAEVLWQRHLNHNPGNPDWFNRDRFVLSNGHGSMLIYGLLHLTGYDLSIQDLKNFRQLHSKTAGHPEFGITPGVETTTGPLGQGISNAVGMAIAEKVLASKFNTDKHPIIDHMTYVFTGDGCLMEGISHEACSLAGTLGLGKLIVLYDDNNISIDGHVDGWFTEDIPKRFESYGWEVVPNVDGHNSDEIDRAIQKAKSNVDKPTLICCKTVIGKGSPNMAGTASAHGAIVNPDEIALTRNELDWTEEPFKIPDEVYSAWDAKESGIRREESWNQLFEDYSSENPSLASELKRAISGELPVGVEDIIYSFIQETQKELPKQATRTSSQKVLNVLGPVIPELMGGSADLTGSNNTNWDGTKPIKNGDFSGNYINYGVREFGMTGVMNGLVLHGGIKPYGGTFLTFLDYARNAVRMAALMKIQTILVYSHDSIGVGEDGPTHQPVEHLTSLRTTPNLETWRPCDTSETAISWLAALKNTDKPTALILSRQGLPNFERNDSQIDQMQRGGYVLYEPKNSPELVLIATGSEVELAMEVALELAKNTPTRVVSMPCTERFDAQSEDYKTQVLGSDIKRVAIEASHADWWRKYVGLSGEVIGMNSFGESAPGSVLFDHFGFTKEKIISKLGL